MSANGMRYLQAIIHGVDIILQVLFDVEARVEQLGGDMTETRDNLTSEMRALDEAIGERLLDRDNRNRDERDGDVDYYTDIIKQAMDSRIADLEESLMESIDDTLGTNYEGLMDRIDKVEKTLVRRVDRVVARVDEVEKKALRAARQTHHASMEDQSSGDDQEEAQRCEDKIAESSDEWMTE